jgi:extracellular matrix regulatory protein B
VYLHLGQNVMLPQRRIIGIFDLDITSQSKRTRQYLRQAEEEGVVLPCGEELPKSFVVCDHPYHRQIVYMSLLNAQTIQKRMQSGESFRRNEHE